MPIDYSKAKIYSIRSPNTDLIYIGSTCQALSSRLSSHKSDMKNLRNKSSKIILEYGNAYIELLENYPCNNKEELLKKEGEYIRNNNCCNKVIAGRTIKEYRKDNLEKKREYRKEYKLNNSEKLKEKSKKYRENNKDEIKEREKQWREQNKEKIKEYMKEYYKNKKV